MTEKVVLAAGYSSGIDRALARESVASCGTVF